MKDVSEEIVSGLSALRESFESKSAESAEAAIKQDAITKDLGDKHAALQKSFEVEQAAKQNLEAQVEAMKAKMDALYKTGNRVGFGGGNSEANDLMSEYSSEMDNYYRKNITPNTDVLKKMSHYIASKTLTTQNEDVISSKAKDIQDSWDSEKGFLLMPKAKKDYITAIDPDGGYFVKPDFRTDFMVSRQFETSPIRSIAHVITTLSNEVEIIIDDDESASGGWVGECEDRPDTDSAKTGILNIFTHEQYAQPKVSTKMLDDSSINIEQYITNKTNSILRRTENTSLVLGNGSKKPKGFLSYNAWAAPGVYERDAIEQINSGISGGFPADSLIDLQNEVKGDYQPNAAWVMKRQTWGDVLKLKNGEGNYLLNIEMMSQGPQMLLLGKPVLWADDMPSAAADSLSIAYGDFSEGYTIVDRLGLQLLRDPYTKKGYVKFYTTKRVGGAVTNYEAIKLLKLAV